MEANSEPDALTRRWPRFAPPADLSLDKERC